MVAATHQTREHRERQETRAKARRYFFIFSSFLPLPEGGTSSRQLPLPRPRWRSRSRRVRMGPRVRRAAALEDRFLSAGCPLPGAHGGADRGASQDDSGDRRCCRGRRARIWREPRRPPRPTRRLGDAASRDGPTREEGSAGHHRENRVFHFFLGSPIDILVEGGASSLWPIIDG